MPSDGVSRENGWLRIGGGDVVKNVRFHFRNWYRSERRGYGIERVIIVGGNFGGIIVIGIILIAILLPSGDIKIENG